MIGGSARRANEISRGDEIVILRKVLCLQGELKTGVWTRHGTNQITKSGH